MDDFTLTNTADYPSPGATLPSAPTGATATAYTKLNCSFSGLDANTRITLPTANTNDTSGDTVWSNETAYGNLTITNDGIQQINLSWTKGTGATNTYIEWNTVSSWSRGAGTLLYNSTGTSATLTDVPAGATRYFELWSWNASGFSETYATASATAGNASLSWMNITVPDIGSGTALLPNDNITLYYNASTPPTYTSLGTFASGYINITTASDGFPFAVGDTLYFRFKAVWGIAAQPDGTYYDNNAQTLDCHINAG